MVKDGQYSGKNFFDNNGRTYLLDGFRNEDDIGTYT
jgi:hypothetical protein